MKYVLVLLIFAVSFLPFICFKRTELFDLVDPGMAPIEIRSQVLTGYNIILETKKNLPEFAGDRISCTNCHFAGGNTYGGVNNGISLVGVTKKYPKNGQTLEERINSCFKKSLNGKPLPVDSKPMQAMVAYLNWIAQPVQSLEQMPWLGLKPIQSTHTPNPTNGEKLYQTYCFDCHGRDGQGQERPEDLSYPPLWGPNSFNSSAGMNELSIIAPFIQQNMPYRDPRLTPEEALDIASFIIRQERP